MFITISVLDKLKYRNQTQRQTITIPLLFPWKDWLGLEQLFTMEVCIGHPKPKDKIE